jgi:hypothetical protein
MTDEEYHRRLGALLRAAGGIAGDDAGMVALVDRRLTAAARPEDAALAREVRRRVAHRVFQAGLRAAGLVRHPSDPGAWLLPGMLREPSE